MDNQSLLQASLGRGQSLIENDPSIRLIRPDTEKYEQIKNCRSSIEIFETACTLFAERPAMGYRAYGINRNANAGKGEIQFLPEFKTLSYREVWDRVVCLASAWQNDPSLGLPGGLQAGDMVGIMAFSSVDSSIADFASLYLGATSVPLQTGMPLKDLKRIIDETQFKIFVCDSHQLDVLCEILPFTPSIQHLLVIDLKEGMPAPQESLPRIKKHFADKNIKIQLSTIQELERRGSQFPRATPMVPKAGTDPLMTLTYTSGSTGFPKGAMFPESIWSRIWRGALTSPMPALPHVTVCYFPLNHILGRNTIIQSISRGGTVYFPAQSDMSTLFEDFRLIQPTALWLVPRVAEMIYQHYQRELARRNLPPNEIMAEMKKNFLGNRLLYTITGSAPTAPEVKEFLRQCFGIPVFEGYGATETLSITFEEKIARDCITDYRIVDVPELGYRTSDKPFPRGELRLKSDRTIAGYFKNPETTKALFDEAGFLKTGDIVEERGPDYIVWVDRKNNVLKLSQGEFVTIWRLESVFNSGGALIKQMYLYGNSSRSYLLGVLVPDTEAAYSQLEKQNKEKNPATLKQILRSEINRIAREAELLSYESPRDFIIETTPFTVENGLLTGTNKPARPALKNKYGAQLEQLYIEIEKKQWEELSNLAVDKRTSLTATEMVKKALEATLGLTEIDLNQSFPELGGDSLHAATLVEIFRFQFNHKVQVGTLLNPAGTLQDIVRQIEGGASSTDFHPSFDVIHGANATTIQAADLQLNKFLPPEEIQAAKDRTTFQVSDKPETFLLTGASGFLGRFLALELLQYVASRKGMVYCIIRAKDDVTAQKRLEEGLATDPQLLKRFHELSRNHLTVIAGDLAKPRLGLPVSLYETLSHKVDAIVHGGALVNHSLSYADLFEPNVLGTVEVIRLALKNRAKSIQFISTIAVTGLKPNSAVVLEKEDLRQWSQEYPCTNATYAEGYALSKWASEILLQDAQEKFSVPVNIFRCSMILPHRVYQGQFNAPDLFTRLLCSIVYTGLAPESFYAKEEEKNFWPHFDGTPVDFVAASIVAIALSQSSPLATYQVSNAHWKDRISLDSVVDWIHSAGYPVSKIPDYSAWYHGFEKKLRQLDENKQKASSLPILHGWKQPSRASEEHRIDARQYQGAVIKLKPEGENDIPHLTEGFIHKYLADISRAGLIAAPPRKS